MKLKLITTIFLSIGVILSACGPSTPVFLNTPSVTTSPPGVSVAVTSRPMVTITAVMTGTATSGAIAAETTNPLTATSTTALPVQPPAQLIPTLNAYCRKGPSTMYHIVTFLQKGSAYDVVGRDSQNTWWLVNAPGVDPCWVGGSNVNVNHPAELALIAQGMPLPEKPSLFTNSYVCNTTLQTLGVVLNWAATLGATGYRIYRNGVLLTTVDGNLTSYYEDAPMNEDLVYDLEAINGFGVSVRVKTSIPACR